MYTLDTTSARKADQSGPLLNEIGKFLGKFTQAEDIVSASGTKGIGLRFEANGQRANLSLYVERADGTRLMSFDTLMAIMTCLNLRTIEPKPGQVKSWDNNTKNDVTKNAQVYPDLCNKPIGLLLETEDYEKQDGSLGRKMVIAGAFQAETELTASEILDRKTTPERLPNMVAKLRHRPLKKQASTQQRTYGGRLDDIDSEIPF